MSNEANWLPPPWLRIFVILCCVGWVIDGFAAHERNHRLDSLDLRVMTLEHNMMAVKADIDVLRDNIGQLKKIAHRTAYNVEELDKFVTTAFQQFPEPELID